MKTAPFVAHWQAGPVLAGGFTARMRLDDERLFAGHYPGAPMLPGSFLIEALAQAVCSVLGDGAALREIVSCRFHSPLRPGDELSARFRLGEGRADGTLVEITARARAQTAELTMIMGPPPAAGRDANPPVDSASRDVASARALDAAFIARALPHRPPALLVDSALMLPGTATRSALIARKAITAAEPGFAAETAPGGYPATLVIESFCQSCGLLRAATAKAGDARDEDKVPVVAKLAGLRLLGTAAPGDALEHHVELVVRAPEGAVFTGQTRVAGRVLMEVGRVVAALVPLSAIRPTSPRQSGDPYDGQT